MSRTAVPSIATPCVLRCLSSLPPITIGRELPTRAKIVHSQYPSTLVSFEQFFSRNEIRADLNPTGLDTPHHTHPPTPPYLFFFFPFSSRFTHTCLLRLHYTTLPTLHCTCTALALHTLPYTLPYTLLPFPLNHIYYYYYYSSSPSDANVLVL